MDKPISELIEARSVLDEDLYVLEQGGEAKKLKWSTFIKFAAARLDGHGGIQSIALTGTSGLVATYTITMADEKTYDIVVKNGRGISSIDKTGTSGLVDTYTISYNDGTSKNFTVKNGEKGDKGDNTYTWIKYASQEPTEISHSMGDIPDDWRGEYNGPLSSPPTDWKAYKWYKVKGDKGDTGDPAVLANKSVTYQVGDSGSIIPSGVWVSSVPVVSQGKYLWTKTELKFNTGDPIVSYSVARMGMDGSGSVSSVNNVSPDENGNVSLTADNVGALPASGGDMTGEIRMNGHLISGLNAPTENTQAGNKGYVDATVRKAAPRNLLDNSDFTRFVAQNGIGGRHDNQAYSGDRWILVSGTVTGEANANGEGYTKITLNGTIRQKLATVPSVATVGIEMVSGTAAISCADGAVTITSAGGVIEDAWCYPGAYTADNTPEYQPKGYENELFACQYYYQKHKFLQYQTICTAYQGASYCFMQFPLYRNMRGYANVTQTGGAIILGTGSYTFSGTAPADKTMAVIGQNYESISNPVGACYCYTLDAAGVTIELSADL